MAAPHSGLLSGFEAATTPLRRELTAHCYRMLGSWDEAEDAVQETYLRAWRAWDRFEERSTVRTWLHRIAANVALSALKKRAQEPRADLQPYADTSDDLRLALIAGLQTLTPGQRAVLLLRDVLAFPAHEVAEMLGLTTGAVKSSLQRARARIAEVAPRPDDIAEPRSPQARRQLEAYMTAFRTADVSGLAALLRRDASLELVRERQFFDGVAQCLPVLTAAVGEPGEWRMEATVANGQPAAVVHWWGKPAGVAVLDCRTDGIAGIVVFGDPGLVGRFAT
ncbi:sigma-70 family RNA polymerase sigma factor [Paractinoplanes lichenicola]|uniref:Sigma-70 family RNA polymerase sigma factor n=1 Tax=Paractinoplanes lichenicola TaxID=2802976 RepID=A0ABS1W6C0_9ACTN|nr:sigma-70 family RNA polymerase sigma factor [Actinoplanes lichenicola]MBL7262280.1 sigma-70 family RNA polymerase sigma factor [Actinoplanes lichenicola]